MIIILILLSIILISFFYKKTIPIIDGWKKILLISLRSISIIILLLLLLNPILYYFKNKIAKPSIIILNDVSDSMLQVGNEGSKLEVFKSIRKEIEKTLALKDHEIIIFDFADGIDGNTKSTNLSKTLLQTFKKNDPRNIEAIILLSDGWLNDDDLEIIVNHNIPVYTFNPILNSDVFDLSISDIEHNKAVYRNEVTPIQIGINSNNYNGKAKVELFSDNKTISKRDIDFDDKEFLQLTFDVSFTNSGFTQISFKITADSAEINIDNNIINSAVQVKRDRSTNLLISDNLNWDAKFIIGAVNQNQHWQSKFLLKKGNLLSVDKIANFETEMNDINVLTLINNGDLSLNKNEVDIIDRFVKKGGGLFVIGKPVKSISNLSAVIPLDINNTFKSTFTLTNQSNQFNTFASIQNKNIKNIPPISYYYARSKIQAKVLAEINNEEKSSAIIFNNIGNGKILSFVFNDLWKWQLWDSGDSYNDFIHNIFSWLGQTNSERFYASLDKNSFYLGEDINIDLHAFDEKLSPISNINAEISVSNSNGKIVHQGFMLKANNKHYITISALPPGDYNYIITDKISNLQTEGEFMISHISPESRDIGVNRSLLSYISNKTNGKVLNKANHFDISKAEKEIIKMRYEIPIYKKWYVIAIFLIAFCTELFLRKRWGLL